MKNVCFFISIVFMFHKMNDKMTKFIEESKHKTKTGLWFSFVAGGFTFGHPFS